ncbi:MAG TPA: GNAT family N-acetyltransferase [Terriglobales bacterium]|nr:GNAT family N-acetyltransferase [Terriglobales bacterium]
MILDETAPRGWDARIAFPLQSSGFAEASRALGHRPLFAEDARGQALVLVRRVPIPLLAGWTARAKVYAHAHHPGFLPALAERLRGLGISHIKVGDSLWGVSGAVPERWETLRPVRYHLLVHDLRVEEAALLAGTRRMIRRHLRKYADDVTVAEVRTRGELDAYIRLAAETGERMRDRDVAAVYPPAYFEAIYREMVPRGQAVLFLARAGTAPLAAATFLVTGARFTQIHGCSTRDRALTPKQGPTFIFWHAMRHARALGCRTFDMGAVTPTADPAHPHYSVYEYKKLWGGRLEALSSAELVLSPWKHRFQERVLAPMWGRLHPVYLRLFSGGTLPESALACPLLELSGQEHRS